MAIGSWLREEILIDFEPHHDSEVDVYIRYAGAHYRYLDAMLNVQFQVCHFNLMSDAIELRPALIVSLDTKEVLDILYFWGTIALNEAILQIELV